MDIKKCFEILDLDRKASIADTKQAYKDVVSVWHPDRFSHNPRLKRKAEEKLKEINIAYETLITFLSSKQALGREIAPSAESVRDKKSNAEKTTGDTSQERRGRKESETRDRTEAIAEAGTRMVLSLWTFFSSKLRQVADSQILNGEVDEKEKK